MGGLYMKSINLQTFIFILVILFLIVYKLYLLHTPAWFPNAENIGDLLYEFCLAYGAGYIFYLLIEFFPKQNDRQKVYSFVEDKRDYIIQNSNELLNNLVQATKIYDEFKDRNLNIDSLTSSEFKEICSLLSPNELTPIFGVDYEKRETDYWTWEQVIISNATYVHKQINDIFLLLPYLDANHIRILSNILNSGFINIFTSNPSYLKLDDTLSIIDEPLYEYFYLIKDLKNNW
jgi:hypothetical protein